jgi:hypothetical protein
MKKLLGLTIFALTLLAVLGAVPAHAIDSPAAPAVAQPSCQPALDLGKLAPAKGETCPATAAPQTQTPEPEFLVGTRTCRCSCGFPCKTDADCGGAVGSCRAGISCC